MDQDQIFFSQTPLKTSTLEGSSPNALKEESSDSPHRFILTSNINQLYKSRDKLKEFAQKIGYLCDNPIRRDVIQHCDKVRLNWNQVLTFEKVEKMTKNRIQKMIKNKRIKKNWSQEDILIFIWIVSKFADAKGALNVERDLSHNDWESIAELIPGVQGENCMFKWLGLKKNNLSDNCWSERQSGLLDKIVKKFGESDWSLISQKLYYSNSSSHKIYRCPKQCRQHWNCYLNPKLKKGPWSKEEDILLLSNVMKNNGQKRWAQIVKMFDGRTENALKNRYTLIIDKELKNSGCNPETTIQIDLIKEYLQRTYVEQFMSISDNVEPSCVSSKKGKQSKKSSQCCENPQRQIRTNLRKRSSMKEVKTSTKNFIDYSELVNDNKSVINDHSALFYQESEEFSVKKSEKKQKITDKNQKNNFLKGNLKMRRANSMPQHLDDNFLSNDEKNDKVNNSIPNQINENHIHDFYHSSYLPKFSMNNNSEYLSNQIPFRSSVPIFQEDEENFVNNHNFWSEGLFATTGKHEKITEESLYSNEQKKNVSPQNRNSIQQQNNEKQWSGNNYCIKNDLNDYYESSLNFGSFEHFINNFQPETEKKLVDTWDLLPSSLNEQYLEDLYRQID